MMKGTPTSLKASTVPQGGQEKPPSVRGLLTVRINARRAVFPIV
jgi:hypothetical protein